MKVKVQKLFSELKSVKEVARRVNTDPATINVLIGSRPDKKARVPVRGRQRRRQGKGWVYF